MTTQTAAPAWASHFTALALDALPADITTATPPQVDEVIDTVTRDRNYRSGMIAGHRTTLHRQLGHRQQSETFGAGRYRDTRWFWTDGDGERVTGQTAELTARALETPDTMTRDALAAIDRIRADDREMGDIIVRCTAEWTRRGWARYYRVNNSNGHVHASTACRETYETTQWVWPTQLSGATPEEVVDAAGKLTCITCFHALRARIVEERDPQWERFESTEQTATRREREQAAATRKAEKIAKGVTPDGSPLSVRFDGHSNEIKTERAAELRYVDCAWDVVRVERLIAAHQQMPGDQAKYLEHLDGERLEYALAADMLAEALAWKRGTTPDKIREQLAAKVERKIRNNTY